MTKPFLKTTKGYTVYGHGPAYNPRLNSYTEISGRVRLVADDPSQDKIVRWDSNHNPIGHDYGQLVRETGSNNATVGKPSGFENIFDGLIGG